MVVYKYGDPEANIVLIQPVGDHDVHDIENEVSEIKKRTSLEFQMVAVKVDSWNQDLSPWRAPAVFGNEDFGEGASALLAQILELCKDESKTYYLGGYSLAGLFALWASCQTDRFAGIASASPSVHLRRQGLCPLCLLHRHREGGAQPACAGKAGCGL